MNWHRAILLYENEAFLGSLGTAAFFSFFLFLSPKQQASIKRDVKLVEVQPMERAHALTMPNRDHLTESR